jgi:hypothetical protein
MILMGWNRIIGVVMDAISRETLEAMAAKRLPAEVDRRLQSLIDRNTDGMLTDPEREELKILAATSENISPLRAKALVLLGRRSG